MVLALKAIDMTSWPRRGPPSWCVPVFVYSSPAGAIEGFCHYLARFR